MQDRNNPYVLLYLFSPIYITKCTNYFKGILLFRFKNVKKLVGLIYINILNYRNVDYFIDIIINEKVSIHYGK